MKLKLDLHDIYNRSKDIDRALDDVMDEAERTKAKSVTSSRGRGAGS